MARKPDCPWGDARGRHIPGTTGCGCPDDPELNVSRSLDRKRSQKRENNEGDREMPPVSNKDDLEWVRGACSKCGGAKVGPWGRRGRIVECPECHGTGTQMTQKPKGK